MKVLSLFDGMACGLQALKQAGAKVTEYHAFEIDKYAIQIAKKNHPEIIHHGSVVGVDFSQFKDFDLLIGGSPCQGFSFAGKQLNFSDPRSVLFFEYVKALKEVKPKNFLLENVKMKKEFLAVISEHVGVEPVLINSALVSAQNRQRYYWANWKIEQPQEIYKGTLLKDIIEDGESDRDKSLCVTSRVAGATAKRYLEKSQHQMIKVTGGAIRGRYNEGGKIEQKLELNHQEKANCITSVQKDSLLVNANNRQLRNLKPLNGKTNALLATSWKGSQANGMTNISTDNITWRKLTPIECERLQTLPDNYTEGVSNTQRYKMLGNGWTVAVIEHIFKEAGFDLV